MELVYVTQNFMDLSIVNCSVSPKIFMHQFVNLSDDRLEGGEHPYFELFSDLSEAVVKNINGG